MGVRWGVVGPGGIAERFARAMSDVVGGSIVAVASRAQERADAFGDRHDIPVRHGSYEALAEDPGVEVVYVATPHAHHERDTLTMISAGKHVLCEKPFALSEAQGRRMVAAARERGVFLMEAMWSRFLPAHGTLTDLLGAGRIGEPLLVEADFGFRMPVLPEHRLFDRSLGGGALLDLGIYPLQLCSAVFGAPDRVVAEGVVGSTGVDETVVAVLHHAGGGLGLVKASIRASLTCTARIVGTEGSIDLPPFMHAPAALRLQTAAGLEEIDCSFEGDGLRFQIEEVHRCLAAGRRASDLMPLDETLRLAATMDAIRGSLGVVYPGE